MALKKVKAKKQIQYALPMMERQLILPYVMTILGGTAFDGAKNDTVTFKTNGGLRAIARDYEFRTRSGPIVLDDISPMGGNIPIKLTTHSESATALTLEHVTLDDVSFAQEVLSPQIDAVVERFEAKALAGFNNLHIHDDLVVEADFDEDPHLLAVEAKRVLDAKKVAPVSGRRFVIGSNVAAAWLASDRLSRYDSVGLEGTPALRNAIIGSLANSPVIEHNGIDPNAAFYMHSTGLVLGNRAPVVPIGAVTGDSGISRRNVAVTWIQDYDGAYARDRSYVHTFLGVNEIRDERRPDGSWIVEEGELEDDELDIMVNRDGTPVEPVPVGTRKNVRIVKFDFQNVGSGSVLG